MNRSFTVKIFLIQFFLVCFFTLVAGEIIIRMIAKSGYVTPEILKHRSLDYEPAIFVRHVFPQKVQQFYDTSQWHHASRYINALGYRGADFKSVKPTPETIRILFYGGSSVFDPALPEGEDWPHKVGKILRIKGFSQIETINAGIPSLASFDAVGYLFTEGHRFSPDYVVLYCAWNDLKQFASNQSLLRQLKPFEIDKNPLLNYQNDLDRFLCEHFQLYVRLRDSYYRKKLNVTPEGLLVSRQKPQEIQDAALKQYRLNLEMFVDLARNIHAVPILIKEARLIKEDNEKNPIFWYAHKFFPHQFIVKSFAETDDILETVAKEKNVLLMDASKLMTGNGEYFEDHIHLSPKGSSFLAQYIADEFTKILSSR